jgi:competence protein ComEA
MKTTWKRAPIPLWMALVGLILPVRGQDVKLPEGKGKDVVERICFDCHGPENITTKALNKDEWEEVVNNMVAMGATGTDAELDTIVQYLAKSFPVVKVNVNKAGAKDLMGPLGLTQDEANAIVAYREKNGGFKEADDLKKVPGVDGTKIDKKKDRLEF